MSVSDFKKKDLFKILKIMKRGKEVILPVFTVVWN